jgi:hypothetical protein
MDGAEKVVRTPPSIQNEPFFPSIAGSAYRNVKSGREAKQIVSLMYLGELHRCSHQGSFCLKKPALVKIETSKFA